MRKLSKAKNPFLFALSFVVVLSLGACSDKSTKREYSLPGSVCGISLPKNKYDPLFPSGGDLEIKRDEKWGLGEPVIDEGCRYIFDDDKVLNISGGWYRSSSKEIPSEPEKLLKYYKEEGKEYPGRFNVWTGKKRTFAATECTSTKDIGVRPPDRYVLEVKITNYEIDGDREEAHKVFGEFAQSLMAGILPKLPCKER